MNRLACVAVLVAIMLAASGCTSGHRLSAPLRKRIAAMTRTEARSLDDTSVKTAQVYGPASHIALVEASLGQRVDQAGDEPKARFYLIVLHGHFVCYSCAGVLGAKAPHGT